MNKRPKPAGLPKMFLVSLRVQCECDNAEVLTETIAMPWDMEEEHAVYMISEAMRVMKAEANSHLARRKKP